MLLAHAIKRPRIHPGLLVAGLCLATVPAAQASTFNWDFGGTIAQPANANPPSDGIFSDAVFDGQGTGTLQWGNPDTASFVNSLSILPSLGSTDLTSGTDTLVQFGEITWTNASAFGSGGVWNTVISLLNLFGTQGFAPVPLLVSATINVNNTEDPSFNTEENNASGEAPDIITLLSVNPPVLDGTLIDLGGGVSILGFSTALTQIGQCGTDGTNTRPGSILFDDAWDNCEGNTSVIGLSALVRYDEQIAPIPLPAAAFLLLGGLAGLGALGARRRRSSR